MQSYYPPSFYSGEFQAAELYDGDVPPCIMNLALCWAGRQITQCWTYHVARFVAGRKLHTELLETKLENRGENGKQIGPASPFKDKSPLKEHALVY